jgi:DNA-binding SARP family transcriptional activator
LNVLVRLLGPVDVRAADGPRPVSGIRRKAILATLALHGPEPVSTGRLLEAAWGTGVPRAGVVTLRSHLSHLRDVLGRRLAITACPPGYRLDLPGDGTDVRRAERLLREAGQAADPRTRVRLLTAAQGLWRGDSLADVTGLAWLEAQAERLDTLHLQVRRRLAEARLAAGEHTALTGDLLLLTAEYPLDEGLCALLMTALYRSGQQAAALAAYRRLRCLLGDELGLGPSQPLRDLELAILRQDPALTAPSRPVACAGPVRYSRRSRSCTSGRVRPGQPSG